MLGLKGICGLAFLFGWHSVALATPVLKQQDNPCLLELQKKATSLYTTYEKESKVKTIIDRYNNASALALQEVPDCSRKPNADLNLVADFNTLFINITDFTDRWWKPVETELLTVIGLQSICLKNHTNSKTNNLIIHCDVPRDENIWKVIYYRMFEQFKVCVDKL